MSHDHSHHDHGHHLPVPDSPSTTTLMPSAHDHNAMDHSSHGNGHAALHHMMQMAFHGGHNETILFEQWTISSTSGLIWSMLVIFILGVLYEGLKYYRENLFWKSYNALQYRAVSAPEKNGATEDNSRVVHMVGEVVHRDPPTIFSWMHFYQSVLHLIQVTLSLMLMLIFMTYNTWLCLAVVFGAMIGYLLFGWKKSVVVDVTEHCH
ncbi:CLUMA_CG003409, isoform A [Clunio marinus]|uniref:Copper transport protein n=1 Tax=Clunio marinus TaxID=568069 RepID=A0A1J1HNR6_9DIPT|nr:CLUMA_CG003409, isoform A [Clunio marinus]